MMSGEQLSVFNEDMVASLRREITDTLSAILPTILKQVIPEVMVGELPKIFVDIMEGMSRINEAKKDAQDYMDSNPEKFNIGYKKRKKLFEGYWRCYSLTNLYEECKSSNPVYIPKKFRDDRFFVRDEEELSIINVCFMGKFDSEYHLLKKRQRDFAAAINAEDDIIYDLIEHCNTTDVIKNEIASIWERDVKGDEEKIKEIWVKKIIGMKAAYEKDKKKLEEVNQDRKAKFEQLRQETRRVELDEDTNRFTISIGSFSMDEGELANEEISREQTEQTTHLSEGAIDTVPDLPTENNEQALAEQVTNAEENTSSEGDVTPNSETAHTSITTNNGDTTEVIDSSAPLFQTQDNDDEEVFSSTQTRSNIQMMAVNFATPPVQKNKIRSNYKFRKRPLLK